VWVAQAAGATPSALNTTGRGTAETKVKAGRRSIINNGGDTGSQGAEKRLCMAGRTTTHTHQLASCERALKSAGERWAEIHTGGGWGWGGVTGDFGEPPARGTLGVRS
jgi:hypothetical protein